eukprot:11104790-Lingulodinium_polyedra.AAC.1
MPGSVHSGCGIVAAAGGSTLTHDVYPSTGDVQDVLGESRPARAYCGAASAATAARAAPGGDAGLPGPAATSTARVPHKIGHTPTGQESVEDRLGRLELHFRNLGRNIEASDENYERNTRKLVIKHCMKLRDEMDDALNRELVGAMRSLRAEL